VTEAAYRKDLLPNPFCFLIPTKTDQEVHLTPAGTWLAARRYKQF